MKLANFKISEDNIGIESIEGAYFDLHNNFDFEEFRYNFQERYFEITWSKTKGDWVKNDEADQIKLSFINVTFLKIKELDQTEVNEYKDDDLTLSIIGYSPLEGSDMESYLAIKEDTNGEFGILIQTENGQAFLIHAGKAQIKVNYLK